MNNRLNSKENTDLMKTILALKDIKEARQFFRDLLTESELVEFSNRWQAAKMLNNNISYIQISDQTGLSSTTIARISKWLNKGMGGYQLMIRRTALHHANPSGK